MKKILIIVLFMLIGFIISPAQDDEKNKEKETQTETAKEKCKDRVIGAPITYYTPETHLAFGAAGSYISRISGCKKDARPSSISPILIYTLEKQFKVQVNADIYLKPNDWRVQIELKAEKFPNKFFGVGNNTLESNIELFTSKSSNIALSFLKKIDRGLNLGLQYNFSNWKIVEVEADGQLATGTLPGSRGGTISGLGFLITLDTRDNTFSAMKGNLYVLSAYFYNKLLGSKFDFMSMTLDLRKYIPLFSHHVVAVQSLIKMQTGDVPFLNLAQLGGQYNMRGYFEGRFRDKNLVVLQAEYRMPLVWRFGLVGFAGVGNVAEKFNEFSLADLKYSYGFGLRFLFDPKERIQARVDVGFGKDTSGFYFSIFEAF